MPKLTIRAAEISDIPEILAFIRDLAVYEKLEDQVVVTAENLREQLEATYKDLKQVFCMLCLIM